MALSLMLSQAGFRPDDIDATAHVTVSPHQGGFKITQSRIVCEAKVPGIDAAQFSKYMRRRPTPVARPLELSRGLRLPSRPSWVDVSQGFPHGVMSFPALMWTLVGPHQGTS
jgi:hypothetical protein